MTDQELQQLARKYAEEAFNGCNGPGIDGAIDYVESNMYEALTKLSRTYCFVCKEVVIDLYESISQSKQHNRSSEMYDKGALSVLEIVFGSELFEERSSK